MKKLFSLTTAMLLVTILALQSGCVKDGDNTEFPDVTASADTINGILKYRFTDTSGIKVADWHFGTATIQALEGGYDVIATATVDTNGAFSLILPATLAGSYFTSLAEEASLQGGTITATPETVRFAGSTQFKVEYSENGTGKSMMVRQYTLKADKTADKIYYYNFYDMDGTFMGTGSGITGNKFNWTFTKGWGMVENYYVSTTSTAIDSKSVSAASPNALWLN